MRRRMLTVRLRAHVCGTSRRVTESSFNSLSLYLYTTTYRHTGAGPCYLQAKDRYALASLASALLTLALLLRDA